MIKYINVNVESIIFCLKLLVPLKDFRFLTKILFKYRLQHNKTESSKARGSGRSIIGGHIFIYSCCASLISFEIDRFYSLEHEYVNMFPPPPPIIDLPRPLSKAAQFFHILKNIEIVQINMACLFSKSDNGQPFSKWQI